MCDQYCISFFCWWYCGVAGKFCATRTCLDEWVYIQFMYSWCVDHMEYLNDVAQCGLFLSFFVCYKTHSNSRIYSKMIHNGFVISTCAIYSLASIIQFLTIINNNVYIPKQFYSHEKKECLVKLYFIPIMVMWKNASYLPAFIDSMQTLWPEYIQ